MCENEGEPAVVHLRRIPNLRVLHLDDTNVSAGIVALQTSLLKCSIFFTGGAIIPGWTSYSPVASKQAEPKTKGKTTPKKPKLMKKAELLVNDLSRTRQRGSAGAEISSRGVP